MSRPVTNPFAETRIVVRPVTLDEERRSQARMMAEDRMVAIGTLASGIAHEINSPIQYIGDSAHFIHEATQDLLRVLHAYRETLAALGPAADAVRPELARLEAEVEVDFLEQNLLAAIERVREGSRRVAHIVRAMKDFGQPGRSHKNLVDVNACLKTTLAVTQNALRFVADCELDLGDLPPVLGDLSALHQVFLNLVLNAVHALEDAHKGRGTRGRLLIRSRPHGGGVEVIIADDGCGIPESIRARIFDPFFTTKDVGRGTGQGLTIARNIVAHDHRGALDLVTIPGWVTSFRVTLPAHG